MYLILHIITIIIIIIIFDFIFNSKCYLQIEGCTMGSICVPSYANIFMPEFEEYHRRHFLWYGLNPKVN